MLNVKQFKIESEARKFAELKGTDFPIAYNQKTKTYLVAYKLKDEMVKDGKESISSV